MRTKLFQHLLSQFLIFWLIFIVLPVLTIAQTEEKKEVENNEQTSLQGLTEAILVDGQPVLRILLGKNNNSTEVKFQKRDGEDTLVYDVYANQRQGKLYIAKSRIIFDPLDSKKTYFNIEKNKIKEAKLNKPLPGDRFIKMSYENDEVTVTTSFGDFKGVNKNALGLANNFLLLTIKDFDSAIIKFQQLTASVQQKDENEEEESEEVIEADINDKYDRFQDITAVSTSKMLVRGKKRSIRAKAEYNFAGKTQKQPKEMLLYFYASSVNPLFREDNLKLNFLVNNERIPLGEMKLADEEKTKTAIKQTIVVKIPYDIFKQIANGKKVEFQIGTLEYKLTDIHLEAFKKLLTYKIEE